MANPLTGDFEAALQIAIRQINGILGTLHQNGATQDAALQTPHSTTGRIGDFRNGHPPPPPPPGVVRGLAKLQAASATITVAQGSSSEITVNAGIRAQYYPDT